MNSREQGAVKWFNESKGYGCIKREQGEDVFVHDIGINGIGWRTLAEGQRVEFQVEVNEKGPQAKEVRVMGSMTDFSR